MPSLEDIDLGEVAEAQQQALVRLHVYFTGVTHRLLNELGEGLRRRLETYADEEGKLSPEFYLEMVDYAVSAWRETFGEWRRLFERARWEAAAIPWGALARLHGHYMGLVGALEEGRRTDDEGRMAEGEAGRFEEQVRVGVRGVPFFEPQLQEVLDAAAERVYSDGFKLSQRLWRLDTESLAGIQRILQEGLAEGESAWDTAKKLEAHLGAGADCPRWTSTRLYRLTKADIAAGDERGLIRGNPCESKGVAYNALRLARNESQIVHHMATDELFARQPWIEREQVVLSPDHPDIGCECEDIVVGGVNGDGVYAKGEVTLPIHVQCLCYKIGVLMDDGQFIQQLRGWMRGEAEWAEMDDYAGWLGVRRPRPVPKFMTSLVGSGPAGTVVGDALKIPTRGKYAGQYQRAIDAIDRVHGDGDLPDLPVKTVTKRYSRRFGGYEHYLDGKPARITINGAGDHIETTLCHEAGHFLDHQAIDGVKWSSTAAAKGQESALSEWWEAVKTSNAYVILDDKLANPKAYEVTIASVAGDFKVTPDGRHVGYLLDPKEVWARSYSQYIAEKSGNEVLLRQLAKEREDRLYGERQWDTQDFSPIKAAIDNILTGLGWLQ